MFIINMRHFSDLLIRMSSPNIRSVNNHKFLSEQIFSPTLPDPKTGTVGGMETEPRELAMSSPWRHPDQSEDRVTSEQADIAETTSGTKNWCAQFPIKKECGRMKSIKSCDDVTLDKFTSMKTTFLWVQSKGDKKGIYTKWITLSWNRLWNSFGVTDKTPKTKRKIWNLNSWKYPWLNFNSRPNFTENISNLAQRSIECSCGLVKSPSTEKANRATKLITCSDVHH